MYLSKITLKPDLGMTQLSEVLADSAGYGMHRLLWRLFSDGVSETDKNKKREFLFREEIAVEQREFGSTRKADPVYFLLSKELPKGDSSLFDLNTKEYNPRLSAGEKLAFKLRVNAVVTRDKKRHDLVMNAQVMWLKKQLGFLQLDTSGSKKELKSRLLDFAGDEQLKEWRQIINQGIFKQKLEQPLGRKDILEWAIKSTVEKTILDWWKKQGKENFGFDVASVRYDDNYEESIFESAAYQQNQLPKEKGVNARYSSLDLSGEVIVTDVARFEKLLFDGIGKAKAFGCGLMLIRRIA